MEIRDKSNQTVDWSSLSVGEVLHDDLRLDASVYSKESTKIRKQISASRWGLKPLGGPDGVASISYPSRFKRIFLKHSDLPIFRPSQITDLRPYPDLFLSDKTPANLEVLRVKYGQILITRSGTIGVCTLVTKTYDGAIFSDDLLRLDFTDRTDSGYTYAFLRSQIGQKLITTNNYGAVIQHVEPSHLNSIRLPYPDYDARKCISDLVYSSFEKRDEANKLLDEAEDILKNVLKLPPLHEFESASVIDAHSIRASALSGRLEATYHNSKVKRVLDHLSKQDATLLTIGDKALTKGLVLPGRFKRVYVEAGKGIVFFGGKQIYELDPSHKKYLSRMLHKDRIADQLILKEGMVLVTCSGTIGKVQLTPRHWDGWTANQHILRIIPADKDAAAYVYLWLQTEYGEALIKRFSYGAVVDELDDKQLASVVVPLINDVRIRRNISKLVLEANELRYCAYIDEQSANSLLNDLLQR